MEQPPGERPPQPRVQADIAEPGAADGIPPFEPLLDQPMEVEPAIPSTGTGPIGAGEREPWAQRAAAACKEGRLTLGAYSEVVEIILQSAEREEFDQAVAEVRAASSGTAPALATSDPVLVAIMSEQKQRSAMRLPASMVGVAIMGSIELDLTQASVSAPVTVIRTFAWWAGIEIRVPPGVRVEVRSIPIMGGVDVDLRAPVPRGDAPVIRLEMVSVMAGGDVRDYVGTRQMVREVGEASQMGLSPARVRVQQSRLEARAAARDARHQAHRTARDARHAARDARRPPS